MDDWIGSGNSGCLVGWTVAKLYAEAAFGQASAGLAVAYGMDNVKEGKATFTEIDVTAGYEFDATTSYSMNIGYAMTNKWKGTEDKANALVIYHGMTVKF
jgi:hypothetical protein